MRPCILCGIEFEGSYKGKADPCLGELPGVNNACCGHGEPKYAYIKFTNGMVVKGFTVDRSGLKIMKEKYRYTLRRKWDEGPSILFIMLNPSTADEKKDDPTVSKCVRFAKSWGFGSLYVGNLFAYRSTDPEVIKKMGVWESIGEENDRHLAYLLTKCVKIVVAWGNHGLDGTYDMQQILKDKKLWCLDINKNGSPVHPLYRRGTSILKEWNFK